MLALASMGAASADTILYDATPDVGAYGNVGMPVTGPDAIVFHWTLTGSFSGVQISSYLAAEAANAEVQVYLTNVIGVGTTAGANEIASALVPVGNIYDSTSGSFQPITLLTGLTLGPGEYFLVLTPNTGDGIRQYHAGIGATTFTTDPSVSNTYDYAASDPGIDPYAPSWDFGGTGVAFRLNIISIDEVSGVPEPSSFALMGGALIGLGMLARRRKK